MKAVLALILAATVSGCASARRIEQLEADFGNSAFVILDIDQRVRELEEAAQSGPMPWLAVTKSGHDLLRAGEM